MSPHRCRFCGHHECRCEPQDEITTVTEEVWAPVLGFGKYYEVSNQGQVRSLDREVRHHFGGVAIRRGRILKPLIRRGYRTVHIRAEEISRICYLHSLVCEAFHGERPTGCVVRHLNGEAMDNRAVNLAWGTLSENQFDRVRHGRSRNANKTHCKNKHPFDEENTYVDKRGRRCCRTCHRERELRSYYVRKEEAS